MTSQHYTYITWIRGRHTRISSPEVTQKPRRVMSPDAEGRGWHNATGLSCHRGADIPDIMVDMWYIYIYVMWHFKIKIQSNKMEHTAPRFLFRFKILYLCLLCLRTASLDLEPYLISNMQNKYTRGWYNCLLCDITVSGGWYNRSCVI